MCKISWITCIVYFINIQIFIPKYRNSSRFQCSSMWLSAIFCPRYGILIGFIVDILSRNHIKSRKVQIVYVKNMIKWYKSKCYYAIKSMREIYLSVSKYFNASFIWFFIAFSLAERYPGNQLFLQQLKNKKGKKKSRVKFYSSLCSVCFLTSLCQ